MKCEPTKSNVIEVPQLTRIFRAEAALIRIPNVIPKNIKNMVGECGGQNQK